MPVLFASLLYIDLIEFFSMPSNITEQVNVFLHWAQQLGRYIHWMMDVYKEFTKSLQTVYKEIPLLNVLFELHHYEKRHTFSSFTSQRFSFCCLLRSRNSNLTIVLTLRASADPKWTSLHKSVPQLPSYPLRSKGKEPVNNYGLVHCYCQINRKFKIKFFPFVKPSKVQTNNIG